MLSLWENCRGVSQTLLPVHKNKSSKVLRKTVCSLQRVSSVWRQTARIKGDNGHWSISASLLCYSCPSDKGVTGLLELILKYVMNCLIISPPPRPEITRFTTTTVTCVRNYQAEDIF
jgi:hypothetical protein